MWQIFTGYTTSRCVGVDISSSAIKMLELKPDKLEINNYKIHALAPDLVAEGLINDILQIADILKNSWLNFKPQFKKAAIAIPNNLVTLREITAPIFNNSYQLDSFIRQSLSCDLNDEEIAFDYTILNSGKESQLVSAIIAKQEKIEEYQAPFHIAEIKLAAIEVEEYALQHLFAMLLNNNQQTLIIELSNSRIRIFVFVGKRFILFASVQFNPENPAFIADDIKKLLGQIKARLLVEAQITLLDQVECYLFGGNSLLPGIKEQIAVLLATRVNYITELIKPYNPHIPEPDLLRLVTALALATWGHKIDTP